MTAKSMLAAVFLMLLAVVAPPQTAEAATHIVGDSLGWTMPFDSNSYSNWASSKTFHVGDILVFNFTTGEHDVTEVTKAGFDFCISTNPIFSEKTGPARITLSAAGSRHFICSFPTHCNFDQKLSVVTVRSQSSTPPATAPSPSRKLKTPLSPPPHSAHSPVPSPPTATPPPLPITATLPPPPNSGNSLSGFGLLFSVGLGIAVAL